MELIFARQRIVTVAKAFGLQAIDMVHIDFKDLEGLRSHSEYSAKMGFTGKQVIHPNQIEIVHDSYRYLLENYRFYHFLDTHTREQRYHPNEYLDQILPIIPYKICPNRYF